MNGGVSEPCVAAIELVLLNDLEWSIFQDYALRLKRVDELFAECDRGSIRVLASMNDESLAACLVLQNKDIVLEVEIDAELLRVEIDAPKLTSF